MRALPATTEVVDEAEISFTTISTFVARHRRLAIAGGIVGALSLGAARLFAPREFTSSVSLLAQQRRTGSQISGLAAQLGVSVASSEGGQSPQFYADLVESPSILRDVLLTRFVSTNHPGGSTLLDVYRVAAGTQPERLEEGMKILAKNLRANVSPKTGLVTIAATAPSPTLAAGIARVVVDRINALNLRLRQEQAAADREFAEQRMTALAAELRAAEDRLQQFMQENRDIQTPRLIFEKERLARDITRHQQIFSSMSEAYEQARIESARESPVVTVVDPPLTPTRPDSRGVLKGLLGGALLGFLIGLALGASLQTEAARAGIARFARVRS